MNIVGWSLVPLIVFLCYLGLLIVILRQGPRRRVNQVFALYLVCMMLWSLSSFMARAGLGLGDPVFWSRVLVAASMGMPVIFYHFVRAFLGSKSHQELLVVGYLVYLLTIVVIWMTPYVVESVETVEGLFSIEIGPVLPFTAGYGLVYVGLALFSLVRRHAETRDEEYRNRIRYLALGVVFIVLGGLTNFLLDLRAYPVDISFNLLNALVIAYAILRYQLLDISLVVRKGLVYSIPTAVIGAAYFLIVFLGVILLRLVTSYQVLLLALVMAAITALAFEPLRGRAQSWIDRLFFREKYDAGLMLQRLSQTAATVLDLGTLTGMILDEVTKTMQISTAAFFLKEQESREYRLAAQQGLEGGPVRKLRPDHPLVSWLLAREGTLTRQQMELMPQFKALWKQERAELDRMEAELFLPLRVRQELTGILILGPKRAHVPYSRDEERTLTTLANQTAVAIENARLFTREQRKALESSALLEIAAAMSSTMDLSRLLKTIAQRSAEVCGVDRCSILLLDEAGNRLLPLMSQFGHGAGDRELWQTFLKQTYTEPLDRVPLIRQVLDEREPAVLDEDSIALLPSNWIEPFGVKSLLAVPLVSKDRATGLMVLDHTSGKRHFTEEQVNLAATIGSQVTIAIENARLYEETIEEKQRTETILAQAFSGILVIDPGTRIIALNPEVEAISGYTTEELVGRRLGEVLGPELCAEGSSVAEVMERGERVTPREAVLWGKNGKRDILLGVTPVRDGYLLSFSDITRLKDVDRLKSSIVANVSHELRAPLASIKAYTELLLDNLEGEDRALRHRFLSIIDQESDWLAELIHDLLDLSRLESGQYVADLDLLSLKEVIDGVITLLEVQIRKKDMSVRLEVPFDLPLILADKELMTILVKNLVGNAVKFGDEGGQVGVEVRQAGENLVLQVVDHGMGIPAEDLPHLFTKFYRSGLAKESGIRGTGLGLVLAKEAAEVHQGRIEVESEPGVATRFTVTLPLRGQTGLEDALTKEAAVWEARRDC